MPATEEKVYSREMQEKAESVGRSVGGGGGVSGGRPLLPSSPQSKAERGWQGRRRGREREREAAACRAKGRLQTGHTPPYGFLDTA